MELWVTNMNVRLNTLELIVIREFTFKKFGYKENNMLDANACWLVKGTYFFAETWFSAKSPLPNKIKQSDKSIILCKMLSDCHRNPTIEIYPSEGESFLYTEDVSLVDSLVFSGYIRKDETLGSFIDDQMKRKAQALWDNFKENNYE